MGLSTSSTTKEELNLRLFKKKRRGKKYFNFLLLLISLFSKIPLYVIKYLYNKQMSFFCFVFTVFDCHLNRRSNGDISNHPTYFRCWYFFLSRSWTHIYSKTKINTDMVCIYSYFFWIYFRKMISLYTFSMKMTIKSPANRIVI